MSILKLTKEELVERGIEDEVGGWWIDDPNNPSCPLVGPYSTKAEAQEDKLGLQETYRDWDNERTSDDFFDDEVE